MDDGRREISIGDLKMFICVHYKLASGENIVETELKLSYPDA